MKNKPNILIFVFITTILFAQSHSSLIGGYSGSSFEYGTSAKEIALSGSDLCNDNIGFRQFSNPASLSNIKVMEYGLSYFSMSLDRSVQVISISMPIKPSGGINISYVKTGTDNIILKDPNNYERGKFNHSEGYGLLAFGSSIGKLSFGVNVKVFFNDLIEGYSGNGVGGDLGLLYRFNKNIAFGGIVKNLGAKYIWSSNDNTANINEETFPNIYSIGISYNNKNILISGQYDSITIYNEKYKNFRIGSEINLKQYMNSFPLLLRLGYQISKSFTVGIGFPIKINQNFQLIFDYAIDPGVYKEGVSHLISFSISRNN